MDYNVFFVVGDSSVSFNLLIPQHGYLIIIIIIKSEQFSCFSKSVDHWPGTPYSSFCWQITNYSRTPIILRWLSGTPIILTLVVRNSDYPDAVCPELRLSGRWLSGTPIIRTLFVRNSNYPDAGCPELRLSGRCLSGTPIIRTLVVRNSNYPDAGCPELRLSGRWLSGTPIIRTLVVRNSDYPDAGCPELRLSGRWLSWTSSIWTMVVLNSDYPDAGCPELRLSGRWLSGTPMIRVGWHFGYICREFYKTTLPFNYRLSDQVQYSVYGF